MKNKRISLLMVLLCCLTGNIGASPYQGEADACKKVMLVADPNWSPYTIKTEEGFDGVAIQLAEKIFSELDIPTQIVELDNPREIQHALMLGDLDMVLSLYDYPDAEKVLTVVRPGFIQDPISIVTRKNKVNNIHSWEDLIGQRGLRTSHFELEKGFLDYASRYLYLHAKGDLHEVANLVVRRKADYFIGSKNQLMYITEKNDLDESLSLVTQIDKPAEVHMGFSKKSACYAYKAYVAKRLKELREEGYVDTLLAKYMPKDDDMFVESSH